MGSLRERLEFADLLLNVWTPEGSVDAPGFAMASMFSRREYSVYVPPEGRSFTPYVWTLMSGLPVDAAFSLLGILVVEVRYYVHR